VLAKKASGPLTRRLLQILLMDPVPLMFHAEIVRRDGKPVGYVVLCFGYSLEWLGRDAFIDEFYLREEYRGCGWGRKTMEFVEVAALKAGIRTLHLEVVRQNETALEVYRKLGFREHDSTFLSKWIAKEVSKPQRDNNP